MIPALVTLAGSPWAVMPSGLHPASLREIEARFAINVSRRAQFDGLIAALRSLRAAGCVRAFLDGSFVSAKPAPGDFDACWDPAGVDLAQLDPVLLTFDNQRAAQKAKFKGEFFPSSVPADQVGTTFIEFFQVDRFTGAPKGLLLIDLTVDSML